VISDVTTEESNKNGETKCLTEVKQTLLRDFISACRGVSVCTHCKQQRLTIRQENFLKVHFERSAKSKKVQLNSNNLYVIFCVIKLHFSSYQSYYFNDSKLWGHLNTPADWVALLLAPAPPNVRARSIGSTPIDIKTAHERYIIDLWFDMYVKTSVLALFLL
jgi:hypothetical protein